MTEKVLAFRGVRLVRNGRTILDGIDATLTPGALSSCFQLPLQLERRDERWLAWAR